MLLAIRCVLFVGRCWFGVDCGLVFVVVRWLCVASSVACALCVGLVGVWCCVVCLVWCVLFVVYGLLFVVWLVLSVV